jgi:hypothetical protein
MKSRANLSGRDRVPVHASSFCATVERSDNAWQGATSHMLLVGPDADPDINDKLCVKESANAHHTLLLFVNRP